MSVCWYTSVIYSYGFCNQLLGKFHIILVIVTYLRTVYTFCNILLQFFQFFLFLPNVVNILCFRFTLEEILGFLEDEEGATSAAIYVSPPDNHLNSDEDSGEEDDYNINHLSGNQLRAQAEATVTRITQDGVEEIQLGVEDLDTTMYEGAPVDVSTSNISVATAGSQLFDVSLPSTSSAVHSDGVNNLADVSTNSEYTGKIIAHQVNPQLPHPNGQENC